MNVTGVFMTPDEIHLQMKKLGWESEALDPVEMVRTRLRRMRKAGAVEMRNGTYRLAVTRLTGSG